MKLLNQSIKYVSLSVLAVISIWAVVFYFNMLNEIKESIDEGLEHYKRQIIYRVQTDTLLLTQPDFSDQFYSIRELSLSQAYSRTDRYTDTMMYMQDADDEEPELEPVRMLTTAFEAKGHYYELRIINSMVEEDDLVKELLLEAIWLYLILIASIIFINNFVLQRLWKPFYTLLGYLKNYRLKNNRQLPEVKTGTKEFVDLQQVIHTLLRDNLETYEQQKQFIGNASHELQTPLAIMITKLELLLERGELTDQQAESIAEVMSISERLVRLNRSLLLLSKIENKQFLNNQIVSINQLTENCVADIREMAEFKNVTLSTVVLAELSVEMDSALAIIIISNLLRNAVFHNMNGGSVTVYISGNSLRIANSGNAVPLDPDKIFSRFYKPDGHQNGTGLGLAIVKAICNLYGFAISYHYQNVRHQFELRFFNQ